MVDAHLIWASRGDIFDAFRLFFYAALTDETMGKEVTVRTTINIDDELLAEAQRLTGVKERTQLIREALVALIERESARRLARLGGSEPDLEVAGRRRPDYR